MPLESFWLAGKGNDAGGNCPAFCGRLATWRNASERRHDSCHSFHALALTFHHPTYPHIWISRYVPSKIGKRKTPPIKAGFYLLACGLSYCVACCAALAFMVSICSQSWARIASFLPFHPNIFLMMGETDRPLECFMPAHSKRRAARSWRILNIANWSGVSIIIVCFSGFCLRVGVVPALVYCIAWSMPSLPRL